MPRVRDLADIIMVQPSKAYLSSALAINWQWQKYERDEADAKGAKQRRLAVEVRAELRGVKL